MIYFSVVLYLYIAIVLMVQIYKIYLNINKIQINKVNLVRDFFSSLSLAVCLLVLSQNNFVRNFSAEISIGFLILATGLLIEGLFGIRHLKNEKYISNNSIKEAIDSSKDGILVLDNNNQKIVENSIMQSLLNKLNIRKDYSTCLMKIASKKIDSNYLVLVEDEAWIFNIDKKEITCFNVDEEYRLNIIISEQNKEIEINNQKIKDNLENMQYIEKEKYIQKLKSKYHDLLGHNLSLLHQLLINESSVEYDSNYIRHLIKKMFIEIEEEGNPKEKLKSLIDIYTKTGMIIELNGKLPEKEEYANVFFEIIREAFTNAIRHANSRNIKINIENTKGHYRMTIVNPLTQPQVNITEHDGIKGMRSRLDEIGGKLFITADKQFKIEAIIH